MLSLELLAFREVGRCIFIVVKNRNIYKLLLITNCMTIKTLSSIVLAGALALVGAGCSHHPQYQEGKVTKESGTVVNIVESSGALFGNESVKFGNPNFT